MEARQGYEFERLIAEMFAKQGYEVRAPYRLDSGREIDMLLNDGARVVPVEVKLRSRRRPISLHDLRRWAGATVSLREHAQRSRPLLIVGGVVEATHRDWISDEFRLDIWDAERLLAEAGEARRGLAQFLDNVDASRTAAEVPAAKPSSEGPSAAPNADDVDLIEAETPTAPQGDALRARLSEVKPGRQHAQAYERVCRDIIDYLFGEDLRDPRVQKRTEDKLNVFDIVYRVASKHLFWATLTRDFRARVVLFECKNYSKPITPMQVFTTERYLSASALRPVCFVLSRLGAADHAVQAAGGAMREGGKLLVFLSDKDLLDMLAVKDAQIGLGGDRASRQANDPTEVLDQKIYDFIAAMPR